jgi:hypothetical protein
MPSMLNEALEWLDRAEQAREVAGQLTDPGARKAVLELAQSFDRLARAAATPAVLRRRELTKLKLPRFRGVMLDLGDYGSVVTASIAAS